MPLLGSALVAVGLAGAKFLVKKAIGVAAEEAGLDVELNKELTGGAADWFKDKVKDEAARKKLTRPFEKMPKTIEKKLAPLFKAEEQARKQDENLPELNREAVIEQLRLTFEDRATLPFFLQANLDAAKIVEQLRKARPLGRGTLSVADTKFYHRALEQLVAVLIQLFGKLPEFPVSVVKEQLTRSERMEDKVDRVQQTLDVQQTKDEAEWTEFEKRYREAVIRKNNHLELFGADIAREAQKLPLSVAYVSLNLESGTKADEPRMRSAEALFDDLRPDAGRLLIRGEAGMGKSTLLRWAAIEAGKRNRPTWSEYRTSLSYRTNEIHFAGHFKSKSSGSSVEFDKVLTLLHFPKFVRVTRRGYRGF